MKKSLGPKILVGATPVWVVGTYDKEGRPNLMTAAWAGVCCSDPPCVGISLRKATYTHGSLKGSNAFTVSLPSMAYVKETDYVGIASGRNTDKWQVAGLTPVRSDVVDAPYVAEFPLVFECKLLHVLELGLHTHFIGEVLDVKAEESVLTGEGILEIEKVEPFLYIPGNRTYFGIGRYLGKAHSIGAGLAKK
ncbi:MAG TPA: flavin reductase family protein [Syntrophorhabdales bacterium]|nr:flavin reductase family protein [Syntrophorhabdales bacterium]